MGKYQIINGNCIEVMANMPAESVDFIFADPPYWMRVSGVLKRVEGTDYAGCCDAWDNSFSTLEEYVSFTRAWLQAARRVLKKDGSLWAIGSMQCIYTIGNALQDLGFWLINDVVWWKNNPTPNMMGTRFCNSHETLLWAAKSAKSRYVFHYRTGKELNRDAVTDQEYLAGVRKQMGSVWRFPVCGGSERIRDENGVKLHSTQKPYALLHRIINLCSNRGDLVLDPFGGTFTTGAAALDSGRNFIGIESNPLYCEYGEKRLCQCHDKNGAIENAVFDQKPVRMSLRDMISGGFLQAGELFYDKSGNDSAELLPDGKIKLADGKITDIHAGAAIIKNCKAQRLNGFDYWNVKRDGRVVGIRQIREIARKNESATQ